MIFWYTTKMAIMFIQLELQIYENDMFFHLHVIIVLSEKDKDILNRIKTRLQNIVQLLNNKCKKQSYIKKYIFKVPSNIEFNFCKK